MEGRYESGPFVDKLYTETMSNIDIMVGLSIRGLMLANINPLNNMSVCIFAFLFTNGISF